MEINTHDLQYTCKSPHLFSTLYALHLPYSLVHVGFSAALCFIVASVAYLSHFMTAAARVEQKLKLQICKENQCTLHCSMHVHLVFVWENINNCLYFL